MRTTKILTGVGAAAAAQWSAARLLATMTRQAREQAAAIPRRPDDTPSRPASA